MIWLVLILAAVLRLISLNQSFWLDEAIIVNAISENSLWSLIIEYSKADFHPPGYLVILWFWTKIFEVSEIAVRLPSVIFGLLTVYLTFLIGKNLVSKKLGLLAALLLAINPLHIYYSQEARMYVFAALVVTLNFFFFLKIIKKEKSAIGYFLSLLLVLSSDYLAYFIIPAQLVILIWLKTSQALKTWTTLVLSVLVVWSWWIPFLWDQLVKGLLTASQVPGWKEVVGSFGIKSLALTYVKFIIGRISHSNNLVYLGLFLPAGLTFLWLLFKGCLKEKRIGKILFSWLLIPILLPWLVSIFVPVFDYFRVLFGVIPFVLLISLGLISLRSKMQLSALTIVLIIELFCSLIYLLNPNFQRENWREAVSFLKTTNAPVLLENTDNFAPFDYYSRGQVNGIGALRKFPANSHNDLKDLATISNKNQRLLLMNYLVEISDPHRLVSKQLNELGYKQANVYNFNGVGLIFEYTK